MLASATIVAAVLRFQLDRGAFSFVDWVTYANAWDRVQAGAPLFAPRQTTGIEYEMRDTVRIGYSYAPATVVLFAPFASWPIGFVAWAVVNIGVLLTGLWAIISSTWPRHRLLVFAAVLAILAVFSPFVVGAHHGNASILIAGLYAWAWAAPVTSGVGGVLGGMMKLAPATLLVFGWRDNRRGVLLGLLVGLAVVILTLPIVGIEAWGDYLTALRTAVPSCQMAVSVACLVPDWHLGQNVTLVLALLLTLGVATVRSRFIAFTLAAFAYLILMPISIWQHYWTLLIVLVVVGATVRSPRSSADTA